MRRSAGTRATAFFAETRAAAFFPGTRAAAFFIADFARAFTAAFIGTFRGGVAAFFFTADFAAIFRAGICLPGVFLTAPFFAGPLRPRTFLAIGFPLIELVRLRRIIPALSHGVQVAGTKLIAEGLPVRATTPMAVSAPVAGSMRKPVMSSLS